MSPVSIEPSTLSINLLLPSRPLYYSSFEPCALSPKSQPCHFTSSLWRDGLTSCTGKAKSFTLVIYSVFCHQPYSFVCTHPFVLHSCFLAEVSFHLSGATTLVLPANLDIFIPLFYVSDHLCLLMLLLSILMCWPHIAF